MNEMRITHEYIAKKSGLSATTLRNWFQGRSMPKLHDIEAVVNAVGGELCVRMFRGQT